MGERRKGGQAFREVRGDSDEAPWRPFWDLLGPRWSLLRASRSLVGGYWGPWRPLGILLCASVGLLGNCRGELLGISARGSRSARE